MVSFERPNLFLIDPKEFRLNFNNNNNSNDDDDDDDDDDNNNNNNFIRHNCELKFLVV